jgi:hypothetical protein
MELYKAIVNKAFNHEESDKLISKSRYDLDQKQWVVPQFMFRNGNKVQFAKEKGD